MAWLVCLCVWHWPGMVMLLHKMHHATAKMANNQQTFTQALGYGNMYRSAIKQQCKGLRRVRWQSLTSPILWDWKKAIDFAFVFFAVDCSAEHTLNSVLSIGPDDHFRQELLHSKVAPWPAVDLAKMNWSWITKPTFFYHSFQYYSKLSLKQIEESTGWGSWLPMAIDREGKHR